MFHKSESILRWPFLKISKNVFQQMAAINQAVIAKKTPPPLTV